MRISNALASVTAIGIAAMALSVPALAGSASANGLVAPRASIADSLPQPAVNCKALPKKIKRNRLVVLRKKQCYTSIGNPIVLTITPSKAGLGKIKTSARGKVMIRTTSAKGRLIVAMTASGSDTHLGYGVVKTVKIK
ncbi:MAG: hypothetical protein WA988_18985 [Candidatus Nanopelagicales bacterium]